MLYDNKNNKNNDSISTTIGKRKNSYPTDQSIVTKSRVPFRMPHGSPDDSTTVGSGSSSSTTTTENSSSSNNNNNPSWNKLGLDPTFCSDCLQQSMQLPYPTVVQQMVIPEILALPMVHGSSSTISKSTSSLVTSKVSSTTTTISPISPTTVESSISKKHLAFLAATGSGKTLAYVLPIMQQLKKYEQMEQQQQQASSLQSSTSSSLLQYQQRLSKRPRALILAPTRELCEQIVTVVKQIGHYIKLSSLGIYGGSTEYSIQKKYLDNRPIDIVVATPGRLVKHLNEQSIILSNKYLQYIVIDEMDTMVEQGFSTDLQAILYPLLYHHRSGTSGSVNNKKDPKKKQQQQQGSTINSNTMK